LSSFHFLSNNSKSKSNFSNIILVPISFFHSQKKQGISTLRFSLLYLSVLPRFPSSPALLCTHFLLHTLMQLLQSHVQPYLHLLQSKACTKSQRYLPPNSDYEIDNSIFSVSSGISTSFSCLSFFSNTMRLFLKLDLTFYSSLITLPKTTANQTMKYARAISTAINYANTMKQ